ncbi:MAG: hypothetical protein Q7Q71_00700 [Verrucomicrobiota bacterium JB023]|nr:hypothetical protein [Verrucomicrobiota bacterium JB023]
MKIHTIVLSSLAAMTCVLAEPIKDGDEIDSYEAAFHHMLHDAAEFYLVCIYEVEKKPWGKEWEQLEIKATVIDPIKGAKKVGEKLNYRRVLDGKYGDISSLNGSLKFVRLITDEEKPDDEAFVDAQDPMSVFRYSPEFHKVAREHRQAEQGGAGQPATAPESKSEGKEKPKPESEGRSQ